jgi:two-component system OmpR family response regulator
MEADALIAARADALEETFPRVLVVDDDRGLREDIAAYLANNGFDVHTARNAQAMDRALAAGPFDLIVLDVMMPGEGGLSICRRLAERDSPAIIILSAMGDEIDRIVGLELGADDYLGKPTNPRELLARVRAVLRRRAREDAASPRGGKNRHEFAGYVLDPQRRRLTAPHGLVVLLTRGESLLLAALIEARGGPLERDQLLDTLHPDQGDGFDRAIDVQISRLRRKLGDEGGDIIKTVRGVGYRLAAPSTRP